jgi:type IV secretory pathway ATPase VirB11/archaellum biosynthesis ATPase
MIYRGWGGARFRRPETRLSVLELVKSGTLDLRLASLLWLLMEHRASVLVAAGPSFAGKTTLFNVLLDFLPSAVKQVELRGYGEDFGFIEGATPAKTYLIAEEFSDYLDYVWGDTAQRAFQLLEEGYGLGGTIHARTPQEVLYVLNGYLEIPVKTLTRLDAIVMLRTTGETHRVGLPGPRTRRGYRYTDHRLARTGQRRAGCRRQ